MATFHLIIEPSAGGRYEHRLAAGIYVLGREQESCDLAIASPEISRRHVRLTLSEAQCTVEDLGSTSGTYRGGETVRESRAFAYPVELHLGTVRLAISLANQSADEANGSGIAGHYTKGVEIAKGGMGAVLEANDQLLGRTVAMKVIRSGVGDSESMRLRFIREATLLARLEHPNIVPIHEMGKDAQGRLFYTMKKVEGRTLQAILDDLSDGDATTVKEFTLDRLLNIFRKVCDAMAFAHAKGVIHRDLKPENIMVGRFGEVLVMDWGLAKVLYDVAQTAQEVQMMLQAAQAGSGSSSETNLPGGFEELHDSQLRGSSQNLTMDGAVMGSPQYMPPEQAEGKVAELDERSDIFSLGGILYSILTLRAPVEGRTVVEVLENVKSGRITPPTQFNTGSSTTGSNKLPKGSVKDPKLITPLPHCPGGKVPAALSAVAMKALAFDPEQRYPAVGNLSADVEQWQGGFATSAEEVGRFGELLLWMKRNRTFTAAAMLVAVLSAGFMVKVISSERSATANAKKAEASAAEAKANESKAKEAADRATKAEAFAVQERETARQALAKSQLDLAEKEFERGKFFESQKILEETPEIFRDANWRFLQAHSHDFTAQLSFPGKGTVHRLQFLPQGNLFAARCNTGFIGIFDITGRQMDDRITVTNSGSGGKHQVFGIDRAGDRIAFSPSAKSVAVQEISTGKVLRRWTNASAVDHVLLSPDGGLVLAVGGNQVVAYAAETGAPRWTHPSTGAVPAFNPDGRTVAILASKNGLDFEIQLLDTLSGAVHQTITGTSDKPIIGTLQFNQAGDQIALLGGDEVILWNPQTNRKISALHFPGEAVQSLSPGGDAVATISGSRIRLWDTASGRLLRALNGSNPDVLNLAFSPDGKTLLSSHASGGDGRVQVWPIRLGEEITSSRLPGRKGAGRRVVFNRDGSAFYACGHQAWAWETQSGRETWKFSAASDYLRDLAIHPTDGSVILSVFGNKKFTHVSSAGEALEAFGNITRSSVSFNRSGQLLLAVAGAFDSPNLIVTGNSFSVHDYPSRKVLRNLRLENLHQPFAAFCLDDAAVATAPVAGGITIWDWKAGKPQRRIAATQTGSIACLASSPDGRHLATGGPDRWIRIWEAATGRLESAFRAHWEGVRCVKFSPDGLEVFSGSDDGTVRIHDAVTGEERLAFYGLTEKVMDVDISADGKLVAAISSDGVTKVWDRQRSSAAALLSQGLTAKAPVAAASPTAKEAPPTAPKPALPKDAEDWENLLAALTPAEVENTGRGWSLKDGELFSPAAQGPAPLPLPGEVSGISYQVRVKLRRAAENGELHIVLPVADRMCGFELERRPSSTSFYTGLSLVNGKWGKDLPGAVEGKQIKDTEPHDLELTVRLDGANATITATLDDKPFYEWTGPTAVLSQDKRWATTAPGSLALGTVSGNWAVSEVKVKRPEGK